MLIYAFLTRSKKLRIATDTKPSGPEVGAAAAAVCAETAAACGCGSARRSVAFNAAALVAAATAACNEYVG